MNFLSLGERKVATARLLCDVSRNHAASLTEPLLAGLLAKARTLPRFISEKALTNQQPELAEDSAPRMLGHRSTPLLQRCCDDPLNRSPSKANWAHTHRLEGRRWSGRRASNPLPRPWQGRALPSELLPLGQREMIPRPVRPPSPHGSARSAGPSGREAGSHASPIGAVMPGPGDRTQLRHGPPPSPPPRMRDRGSPATPCRFPLQGQPPPPPAASTARSRHPCSGSR